MKQMLNREKQLAILARTDPGLAGAPIVFVSYGAGHAAALAPVAMSLAAEGLPVVCIGLTTASTVFLRYGIEVVRMQDLVGFAAHYKAAARLGKRLRGAVQGHGAIDALETDVYMGVGFLALVRQLGLRQARVDFARRGRQGFCPTEFFAEVWRHCSPGVVVATSAPRSERAALEAARGCGIARMCVVDLFAPYEVQWCAATGFADVICVLTEEVAQHFRAHGVPAAALKATGNPSFDRLATVDQVRLRHTFRARRGLAADVKVLGLISQEELLKHPFNALQGDPSLPARLDAAIAGYFGGGAVHVVIRFHPNETREKRDFGPQVSYSAASENLDELLCGVDCVLTSGSTVGLEAAMLGKPVVQFLGSMFSADLPLASMELAAGCERMEEIGPVVDHILASGQPPGKAVDALRKQVGVAVQNVANEIRVMYLNSENRE